MATQGFRLERFQAGQPLLSQLTARRLNSLIDAIEAARIRFGVNVTGQFSSAGTTINANPGGSVSTPPDEHPFQVVTRSNPDTGAAELGVVSDSHLFNSEDNETYEEDNSEWGLLNDDQTSGWFGVPSIGEKIWLEISLNAGDQSITSVELRHESTSAWPIFPDPIYVNVSGTHFQSAYRQIIAEVTDPEQDPRPGFTVQVGEGDARQVTQLLFSNLQMCTAHTVAGVDGPSIPLVVAVPINRPATSDTGNADEINTAGMVPFAFGSGAGSSHTFQLLDASNSEGTKALILDGVVYGPTDDGHTPSGMGADNYIIDMNSGDDAYLVIPIDSNTREVIPPITIDTGPVTPDDDDTTLYVTIGNLSVDGAGIVTVENTLCGDYVIPKTLDVVDELETVTEDIQSIQFTTDGSENLDVTVVEDAPGEVTVHMDLTPNSTLQNLANAIDNAPNNSVLMKDAFGNLTAVPVEDCSKC
jgi:hypothetical protein